MNYSIKALNAMVSASDARYAHEAWMYEQEVGKRELEACALFIKAVPSPMVVHDDDIFNGCITHFHTCMIDEEIRQDRYNLVNWLSDEDFLDF